MMNNNETAVTIVQRLINSGALNQLAIASLKDSLEVLVKDVEYLSKKTDRKQHQHEDFVNNLHTAKAICVVLGFYGCNYDSTLAELNKIETSLMNEFV